MNERIKEVSLVDRINDLLFSSILRLHGPNKNHDDCFHCQLIIDLKKIRQALTSTEAELQAEREKVSRYNLAVKAIHDVDDIAEFQKQLTAEAEKMDREELTAYYLCAMSNWAIVLYERDKAEAELADLRGRLKEAEEIINHVNLQFPLEDYGLSVLEDVRGFLKP